MRKRFICFGLYIECRIVSTCRIWHFAVDSVSFTCLLSHELYTEEGSQNFHLYIEFFPHSRLCCTIGLSLTSFFFLINFDTDIMLLPFEVTIQIALNF